MIRNSFYKSQYGLVTIVSLILFLCPLLAFPCIIYGVYHRWKGSFFLLALFLGLVAYLTIPTQDLYRHTLNFYYWEGKPLSTIELEDVKMNGIIVFLYNIMVNNGVPFEFIRFSEAIIAFLLLSSIFNYKIEQSSSFYTNRDVFIRFCIFFFFFDYLYTVQGVRYGFALSVYLYGFHLYADKKDKFRSILFFLLSWSIHQAFLLFGFIVLILMQIIRNKYNALIAAIILSILFNSVFLSLAPAVMGIRADWYLQENSQVSNYSYMTAIGSIFFWGPKIMAIPFVFLLFKNYYAKKKWCSLSISWLVVSLVSLGNAVFFYRTWWAFTSIGIYLLLDIEDRIGLMPKRVITKFLLCGCIFILMNMTNYHSSIMNSKYHLLVTPVPYILSNTYSYDWVMRNIDEDGVYIKTK